MNFSDAELFWITKHGIKMSGMPGWADHSDEELWATVAFLRKLPAMTPEDYATLVMAAVARGGPRDHDGNPNTGHPHEHGAAPHSVDHGKP